MTSTSLRRAAQVADLLQELDDGDGVARHVGAGFEPQPLVCGRGIDVALNRELVTRHAEIGEGGAQFGSSHVNSFRVSAATVRLIVA